MGWQSYYMSLQLLAVARLNQHVISFDTPHVVICVNEGWHILSTCLMIDHCGDINGTLASSSSCSFVTMQPLPQCLETTTHLRWKSCGDSLFATRGSVSEASLIQVSFKKLCSRCLLMMNPLQCMAWLNILNGTTDAFKMDV